MTFTSFLKVSENSEKNTCDGVLFKAKNGLHERTPPGNFFCDPPNR